MTTPHHAGPSFRLSHPHSRVAVGLMAAVSALACAFLVFGPMSDQRTFAMAGVAPHPAASEPQGPREVRVATSLVSRRP